MKADLHMHTNASDGTWSPEAVMENVTRAKIKVFAVTDHDSVKNVEALSGLVKDTDLNYIKGVEISSTKNGRIFHILGYNIDTRNNTLNKVLEHNSRNMEQRDEKSIETLMETGHPVSLEEFLLYKNNPDRGGWKALNYVQDKGLCSHYKDFFKLFENPTRGMNIDGCVTPEEAISAVKEAGGIPVLAHPGSALYGCSLEEAVSTVLNLGIEGFECFHPENSEETTEYCLEVCKRENLFITGGSDCHGTFVKERRLGKPDIDFDHLTLWDL